MDNWLERTEMLLGTEKLNVLKSKHVLIVGLGGVGAYAAEMICRAGVGKLTIIDGDIVNPSNINRQLPALHSTVRKPKATIVAKRLKDINPNIELIVINEFIEDDKFEELVISDKFDFVVDAIDTLAPKIQLIVNCLHNNIKLISSMGAGGKTDPSMVQVVDIKKSYNCMLARMLRKRLSKFKLTKGFPVVFSPEFIDKSKVIETKGEKNKRSMVGTISYMPALFGIHCAAHVINTLILESENKLTE